MAEAIVAVSRQKLAEILANWPGAEPDTSWAVVMISVVPTAAELAAVREAAAICDRVVVARLVPDRLVPPKLAETVRSAGGDVLFVPTEVSGRVEVAIKGEKVDVPTATLLMQTLLTVMPMVVVVPRGEAMLVRLLRAVSGGMGDFFSLRIAK